MKTKHFLFFILILLVVIIISASTKVLGQPPGLPSTPDQAPIDGGLGLLAAAGGAYVLKKLRNKKSKRERNETF